MNSLNSFLLGYLVKCLNCGKVDLFEENEIWVCRQCNKRLDEDGKVSIVKNEQIKPQRKSRKRVDM